MRMCVTAGFVWTYSHWAEMTKNGQKWPPNRVFRLYGKVKSLFLWSFNILQKLPVYKKSGSQVVAKNALDQNGLRYDLDGFERDMNERIKVSEERGK